MAKRLGRVEVFNGMRTVSRTQIRCDCGEELVCMYNTNTCDCGRDYNMSGQMLADRTQWGQETGEHPGQTKGHDMTNQDAINEAIDAINTHMHAWNGTQGAHLDACTGFAVWAQYAVEETRAALVAGDLERLADGVVYSLAQDHHEITDEQATEWLKENREELIAAIDDI